MKKDYGYPSYDLICRATNGDEKAVREILDCKNKGRYTAFMGSFSIVGKLEIGRVPYDCSYQ